MRRLGRGGVAVVVAVVVAGTLAGAGVRATRAAALSPGPYPGAGAYRGDGILRSAPATVFQPSFGHDAFATGNDGALWWSSNAGSWNSLGAPPAGVVGDPAAVSWGAGRIDLFVRGGDDHLWQLFSTCGGCQWSRWSQPVGAQGILASSPTATSRGPGQIDIFALGGDGGVWQRFWYISSWNNAWFPLGGNSSERPAAAAWGANRVDVFVTGGDGRLWQKFWSGSAWSGWAQPAGTQQGNLASAPSAAPWGAGPFNLPDRLSVFTRGTDGHLFQTTWDSSGNGSWTSWALVGRPTDAIVGAPAVPTTLQLMPYVLARGADNLCYAFYPDDPLPGRANAMSAFAASRAGIAGFTLVDTATGEVVKGGTSDTPTRTASIIKVPIAMTLVSMANAQNRSLTPSELSLLHLMITQSDNNAATSLWNEVGGSSAVLGRMDSLGATETFPDPSLAWGFTWSTSRDFAIVLARLALGVLGPSGTNLILGQMHQVIPSQAWGIGAAIPGAAIKNGWFPDPTDWRVNCLGIAAGTRYALAVMTQYPIGFGQGYGEATCQQIASGLLPGVSVEQVPPPAPRAPATRPALSGIGMTVDGG
jgi:Beta-lactamase enzyme family